MRPRKALVEQFSTFAQVADDQFQGWRADPRLKLSMVKQLELAASSSLDGLAAEGGVETEQRWALYWYELWQSQPSSVAKAHLFAYLQEPCYWAAREVAQKYVSLHPGQSSGYCTGDYFQMAMAALPDALGQFRPDRSSQVKSFIQIFISSRLKALLRQSKLADFCTPWALLRKTSKRRMGQVLTALGLSLDQQQPYLALLLGFQELYLPVHAGGSARLPKPEGELWQSLAGFYNQRRSSWCSPGAGALDAAQVEDRLIKMAQWVRNYLYPSIDSINRGIAGEEGDVGEIQDRITSANCLFSDGNNPDLLTSLMEIDDHGERQQQLAEMTQVLAQAYGQLDGESQRVLALLYGDRLSQMEVSRRTNLSQATVSRRAGRARGNLQKAMLAWSEQPVNRISDPDKLKSVTNMLEDWLELYLSRSTHD